MNPGKTVERDGRTYYLVRHTSNDVKVLNEDHRPIARVRGEGDMTDNEVLDRALAHLEDPALDDLYGRVAALTAVVRRLMAAGRGSPVDTMRGDVLNELAGGPAAKFDGFRKGYETVVDKSLPENG